jgi:hypothetical protein
MLEILFLKPKTNHKQNCFSLQSQTCFGFHKINKFFSFKKKIPVYILREKKIEFTEMDFLFKLEN